MLAHEIINLPLSKKTLCLTLMLQFLYGIKIFHIDRSLENFCWERFSLREKYV